MSGTILHVMFDAAAWLAAGLAAVRLSRLPHLSFPAESFRLHYIAAMTFGAALGAYLFGTLNLWLSGQPGIARSVEGALAGGIVAIEIYKWRRGIDLRTGARFALSVAIGIAVGRIGCFLAGLEDFTYGTPTTLPWGRDFGDGIARHPVQLYESAAMGAFAIFYIAAVVRRDRFVIANGLDLALAYYGAQRFIWEFLKPYGSVVGPLTLFQLLSLVILAYATGMLAISYLAASNAKPVLQP